MVLVAENDTRYAEQAKSIQAKVAASSGLRQINEMLQLRLTTWVLEEGSRRVEELGENPVKRCGSAGASLHQCSSAQGEAYLRGGHCAYPIPAGCHRAALPPG